MSRVTIENVERVVRRDGKSGTEVTLGIHGEPSDAKQTAESIAETAREAGIDVSIFRRDGSGRRSHAISNWKRCGWEPTGFGGKKPSQDKPQSN